MIKKLPNSQIEIELTVEWKEWEKYIVPAVAEISAEFKISGFRPGKAPRNIIEQKVGKEMILSNAAEKAISKSYGDFIRQLADKEKNIVLGSPKVEIEKIVENENLIFKAIVAVMPEVKVNDDYKKSIKKINEEYKSKTAEAGEDEIKLELEKLANSRVKLVTVRRAIKNNDSAEIDFTVSIDGAPIENGTSKKHLLTIGKGVFIPGFEEKLIGMSEGEEKEFDLPFPADYFKKDLAGKMANFKVKINLVQERQTPEINDDFAISLGKFKDLSELKKNIQEGLEHENEHKMKEEKNNKYLDEIVKNLEVELPEILIQDEKGKMFIEFEQQIQSAGMTAEDYLSKIKKTKEELMKDWAPQAEKRVKSSLALKEIAKMEEIKIDTAEIEAEMNKTLQYYKNVKDFEKNIGMERLYSYTKGVMENERVFEMLEKL